ncbi:DUF4184 family protein [Hymenobacter terrenus]|uniref:DUF4184 family protein n=1 Tax=Hymenobacter terrenus TaxID=1629124 RepID=UPI000907DEA2|nr:DUF4184 family protein [Hymenobacter terrenus]
MPFTFSHPALIIPFLHARRRHVWLSATGLIIGSIAPDFEKFFKLHLASSHSHTIASIFYFSCPVSLGLAFLFHGLVRRPLLAHLPVSLHQRLGKYTNFDWLGHLRLHPGGVLLSIVLGAASHLVWDSFTHPSALMMSFLPGLCVSVRMAGRSIPLYLFVALGNSLLGGLFITRSVWQMPTLRTVPAPVATAMWRYWGLATLVTVMLVAGWALAFKPRLLNVGIAAISAAMVGLVIASAYAQQQSPTHGRLR